MKYFCVVVLFCLDLGDCADNVGPAVSSSYGSVGPLKNYAGIFSPTYNNKGNSYDDRYDNGPGAFFGQGFYGSGNFGQGSYGLGNNGQGNYGSGNVQGGQNNNSQGNAQGGNYGQAGTIMGGGNQAGIGSGFGLSAGLGLSAALSAGLGFAANFGNAIGIGINGNLQLNLDAELNLSNQEDIVRPCNLDDWQCIRKFFATNSQCSPAYGPVPDPLFLAQSTSYIPFINLNLLLTNVRITGLGNAKIRDFYVNRVTGNLVFTIDIQNFNQTSPRSYMKYQRLGRESVILADFTAFFFSQVSLTVVIPRLPNLRLDLAEIHADIQDDSPQYDFGPGITNSTMSLALSANAQLSANLQAVIRESFLFQAQLLAAVYIQQSICDFGMKLSSV